MEEKKEPLLLQQQREIDDDNVFWAKIQSEACSCPFVQYFLYVILGWYQDNLLMKIK